MSLSQMLRFSRGLFKNQARKNAAAFQSNLFQIRQNSSIKNSIKITGAEILDSETLKVVFENGNCCNFKHIWLRDNCQCSKCVDVITKHKLNEFACSDIHVQPSNVILDSNLENLKIEWSSSRNKTYSHQSSYQSNWLNQFTPVFNGTGKLIDLTDITYNNHRLPAQSFWTSKTIENIDLKIDYDSFMNEKQALFNLLENVHKYGMAIIKNVPAVQNQVVKISERISFVKETGYGRTFQIKINPHPKTHLTYTGKRFELHSDLSYFQNAPGIQLIHCITAANPETVGQESAGGISFFSDSFYWIETLRSEHPDYFHLLSTVKVPLAYLDAQRNRWIRRHRTLIETNSFNEVTDFYCTDFSLRPPLIRSENILPFYKAYHLLMSKISDEKSLLKFYLSSGDLVVFNNKRILHGRDEYDPTKVERHLEGCYMDLQELTSLYEKMFQEIK